MKDFSIVILNYNVKYFTDACLQSVLSAVEGKNAEIIVADNQSTDGSKSYLEHKFPHIKFLWFDTNYGFAKAYNKAVQHATGTYLLILNPDTLVSENILDILKDFAKQHPGFGILGGKMIDGTGHFLPESKRGIPTPLVAFSKLTQLYKLLKIRPFNNYYAEHLSQDQTGKIEVLTGAFMFLTHKTYLDTGGFDEQYFMYGEDIDLSYTVLKSGKQNYYVPAAQIIHFKGESAQKDEVYYQRFLQTTFQFYNKHFRSFPVQEFMMKSFFKLWLHLRIKKSKAPTTYRFNQVYYWGNTAHLQEIKKEFKDTQITNNPDTLPTDSLLIFDTSTLPFSKIIHTMQSLKQHKIAYRFYFPDSHLLLGSDHKDRLGEVKILS